jgi:hypothetical protein
MSASGKTDSLSGDARLTWWRFVRHREMIGALVMRSIRFFNPESIPLSFMVGTASEPSVPEIK